MQIVDETLAGLNETLLRPVYTGDFCRAIHCNFLICNFKIARVNEVRFQYVS